MRRISDETQARRSNARASVTGEHSPVTDRAEGQMADDRWQMAICHLPSAICHQPFAICHRPIHRNRHSTATNDRAGFSLLEMFVAVVVFGTVLMTFLPLMKSVGTQQRMTDQRLLALRETNNLLEQLSQRKWNELTEAELAKLSLPDDVKSRLPQAAMRIELTEPDEPLRSKRVAVKVSWTPRTGQAAQSVQLVTWFFATEGQP
ncbi:MAG: hypothetical protein ACKV2Q_12960 [Planctomycetaceae bacterium]